MPTAVEQLATMQDMGAATASWRLLLKAGGYIPYRCNRPQAIIRQAMEAQRDAGEQVRLAVLKYRQAGVSTECAAQMQVSAERHHGWVSMSIADKQDLPAQWLRRAKRWWGETPEPLRPHLGASNAMELWYPGLDSRYFIGSQAGQTPGMGHTIRGLHCSEMASWDDPVGVLLDLLPAIPKPGDTSDVLVIFESTGEQTGGWWADTWQAAHEGRSDYRAVFLPWSLHDEYRMDAAGVLALTPEEQLLVKAGLDREQIAWRRWTIRNEFDGDQERFASKYPLSPDEAWLDAGRLAIRPEILRHHAGMVKPPVRRVRLSRDGERVVATDVDSQGGAIWDVWYEPVEYGEWAVGGDVAEGRPSDPADPRSEPDWSAGVVFNRRECRVEATCRCRIDPDVWGEQLDMVADWYGNAWRCPELNGPGLATLASMRRSTRGRLFIREGPPDAIAADLPLAAFGWRTTASNRDLMIDEAIARMRSGPDGWQGTLVHHSSALLAEERAFVYNKLGKREHRPGHHDDLLFGLFLAVQLDRRCPRGLDVAQPPMGIERLRKGPEYVGGFDDWEPGEDEE